MNPDHTRYITYLVRLWPTGTAEQRCWHVLLENPRTGERHVFRDIPALCAFLEERTRRPLPGYDESADPNSDAGPTPPTHPDDCVPKTTNPDAP